MPIRELNISEIANEVAEGGLLAEANAARTIRTGMYRLHLYAVTAQQSEDVPGATPYLRFQVTASQGGVPKGKLFFNATWEKKYRETASGRKLVKDAMLYGQLLKALGLTDGTTVRDLLAAFESTDVSAFVTESLQSPEKDKYVDVIDIDRLINKDLESGLKRIQDGKAVKLSEAGDLIAAGYTANNYVQAIFKLKED